MKEIVPPVGKRRVPRVSARYCSAVHFFAIVCLAFVFLLGYLIVSGGASFELYLNFTIAFLPALFITYWLSTQTYIAKTVSIIKEFNNADAITLQEYTSDMRLPFYLKWIAKSLVKKCIKKGYVTNYKYQVEAKLLVRIDQNAVDKLESF